MFMGDFWVVLAFVLALFIKGSYASLKVCVQGLRFYAEDVDLGATRDIIPYFTAHNVSNTVDCVKKCVELDFCRSALFNAGAQTCAISYGTSVKCYRKKERVETWTSGGLTMIHCTQCEKFIVHSTVAPATKAAATEAPATAAPATKAPSTEAAASDTAATEAPATAAPATKAPAPEGAATEAAATEAPATAAPATKAPATGAAATEAAATEAPATAAPATKAPTTEAAATEAAATEAPVTAAPATKAPATEAAATEAAATEAPATAAPATKAPATEAAATEAPVTAASATKAPTPEAAATATEAPATENPATEASEKNRKTKKPNSMEKTGMTEKPGSMDKLSSKSVEDCSDAPKGSENTHTTQEVALSMCRESGSELYSFGTAQDYMDQYASIIDFVKTGFNVWTGLIFDSAGSQWRWTDGSELDWNPWLSGIDGPGEPSCTVGCCGAIRHTGPQRGKLFAQNCTADISRSKVVCNKCFAGSVSGNKTKGTSKTPGGTPENDGLEALVGGIFVPPPCFDPQLNKVLVNAAFAVEENVKHLKWCQCLCAGSWLSKRYNQQCKSVQYYPAREECFLNSASQDEGTHFFANLVNNDGSYYDFICRRTELDITQYILNECQGLLPPPGLVSLGGEPKSPNGPSQNKGSTVPLCWDTQPASVLTGVAGGIAHNVTFQECQCLCANSKNSGRFGFDCKSAMWYKSKNDCILNMDHRINRPDQFRKDTTGFNSTYTGLLCLSKYEDNTLGFENGLENRKKWIVESCPEFASEFIDHTTTVAPEASDDDDDDGDNSDRTGDGDRANMGSIGGTGDQCFTEYPGQVLVRAAFAVETNVKSLSGCHCLCASNWLSNRYGAQRCRSVQYFHERQECFLNAPTHDSHQLANLLDITGSYYEFTCRATDLAITQYVLNECVGLIPPPGAVPLGGHEQKKTNDTFLNAGTTEIIPNCWDIQAGYIITGVAGGSVTNISGEECQCHCATSRSSGRYSFDCKSANYYQSKRDCILNLNHRVERPDLFRKDSTGYGAVYIGLLCQSKEEDELLGMPNGQLNREKWTEASCLDNSENSGLSGTEGGKNEIDGGPDNGDSASSGVHTDRCYIEVPGFILKGQIITDTNGEISLEACKCFCLYSLAGFEIQCRSIQYNFDTKQCFLNLHARADNESKLQKVEDGQKQSYLDNRCVNNDFVSRLYANLQCRGLPDFEYEYYENIERIRVAGNTTNPGQTANAGGLHSWPRPGWPRGSAGLYGKVEVEEEGQDDKDNSEATGNTKSSGAESRNDESAQGENISSTDNGGTSNNDNAETDSPNKRSRDRGTRQDIIQARLNRRLKKINERRRKIDESLRDSDDPSRTNDNAEHGRQGFTNDRAQSGSSGRKDSGSSEIENDGAADRAQSGSSECQKSGSSEIENDGAAGQPGFTDESNRENQQRKLEGPWFGSVDGSLIHPGQQKGGQVGSEDAAQRQPARQWEWVNGQVFWRGSNGYFFPFSGVTNDKATQDDDSSSDSVIYNAINKILSETSSSNDDKVAEGDDDSGNNSAGATDNGDKNSETYKVGNSNIASRNTTDRDDEEDNDKRGEELSNSSSEGNGGEATITTNEGQAVASPVKTNEIGNQEEFPDPSQCRFSAYYDMEFKGKLIIRNVEHNPSKCFRDCVKRNCKSMNMIQFSRGFLHCEMFEDAAVYHSFDNEFITYNRNSVYFDGISCPAS